ncbi:MAG: tetratricopeptide repeat protein [Rhodocyclaceae bacterium]
MAVPVGVRIAALVLGCAAFSHIACAQEAPRPRSMLQAPPGVNGELVANILLAETAAQRGQPGLGASLYLSMAQVTRNGALAKRAHELALAAGQLELSAQAGKLWLELEPDAPGATQAFVRAVSGQTAKLEDVEIQLRKLLESETMPVEGYIDMLPGLLSRYPDKAAVLAMIERLTRPYGRYAETHYAVARAALDAGDSVKAEAAAQRALDKRPDFEAAARLRALAAPATRWTAAIEELGRFGKRFPQARQAREQYARWLVSVKRDEEALAIYRALFNDSPDDEQLANRALGQWMKLDKTGDPEALVRRLKADKAGNADTLRLFMSSILERQGKFDEAAAELIAIESGSAYMNAAVRRVQLLAMQGKSDEARTVVSEAVRRQPQKAYLLVVWQANAMSAGGRSNEALQMLENFLGERPDEHDVLFEAGMVAEKLGRHDDMERYLKRAISVQPDEPLAYNALGYSLADRNLRLAEAERLLVRAVRLSPESAAIVDSLGWLRFRQGKLDEAIRLLRQAKEMMADAEISAHLGEALWRNGQKDEARKVFSEAESLDPDNLTLKDVRQRLLQ